MLLFSVVCWTDQTHRATCVHTLEKKDLALAKLNKVWALFWREKKLLKGSVMLLSWQHCASPFLQLQVRPWVKLKIRAMLVKWVPLKWICVNALLTALIYLYSDLQKYSNGKEKIALLAVESRHLQIWQNYRRSHFIIGDSTHRRFTS